MTSDAFMTIIQLILSIGQLCIMGYALSKFISKPHNDLNTRVTKLEVRVDDVEESLKQGNDRFREQAKTNEVIIHSVLALIEFEMQYCLTEHKEMSSGLSKAKEDLHNFLSSRGD